MFLMYYIVFIPSGTGGRNDGSGWRCGRSTDNGAILIAVMEAQTERAVTKKEKERKRRIRREREREREKERKEEGEGKIQRGKQTIRTRGETNSTTGSKTW
jgi:hypothetical protein